MKLEQNNENKSSRQRLLLKELRSSPFLNIELIESLLKVRKISNEIKITHDFENAWDLHIKRIDSLSVGWEGLKGRAINRKLVAKACREAQGICEKLEALHEDKDDVRRWLGRRIWMCTREIETHDEEARLWSTLGGTFEEMGFAVMQVRALHRKALVLEGTAEALRNLAGMVKKWDEEILEGRGRSCTDSPGSLHHLSIETAHEILYSAVSSLEDAAKIFEHIIKVHEKAGNTKDASEARLQRAKVIKNAIEVLDTVIEMNDKKVIKLLERSKRAEEELEKAGKRGDDWTSRSCLDTLSNLDTALGEAGWRIKCARDEKERLCEELQTVMM